MRTRTGASTNGRHRSVFRVCAAVAAVSLAAAACGSSAGGQGGGGGGGGDKATLDVGVAIGLTGYLAGADTPFSKGVKLAADYLNKNGGIDGHKVQLYIRDMKSNAAAAVPVINQLLHQNHVTAQIGGSVSAATAAETPILSRASVPILAASVLSGDTKWAYSTLQPVAKSNAVALGFAQSVLHAKKIAVLFSETPYGQSAGATLGKAAAAQGLQVVSSQGVSNGATDLTPQLSKAKSSGADVILDVLTGPVHIAEAKAASGMGLGLPLILGQDALGILKQATQAYSNAYFTGSSAQLYPQLADAQVKAANAKFQAQYKASGQDPNSVGDAGRGWDTMMILAQAVHASGAVSGEKLRAALEHVTYPGTMSRYKFTPADHTGQQGVPNPLGIAQFHGATFKVVYRQG